MTPIQTIISNVGTREVNTKQGGKFNLHEIYDQTGQAWVAKKDVWQFASGLIGQPVQMMTRTEQNGSFTNYYADAVMPLGVAPPGGYQHPADNPQGVTQREAVALNAGWDPYQQPLNQAAPPGVPVGAAVRPQDSPVAAPPPWLPNEKDLSIYRQTASKVAAWLATNDNNPEFSRQFTFWSVLPEIMHYYKTGNRPDWVLSQEVADKLHEQTEGEKFAEAVVAASGNGENASPPTVDDIPF